MPDIQSRKGQITSTEIHKYTNTQIHKYANTQIHKYANMQIHIYTNTQIQMCHITGRDTALYKLQKTFTYKNSIFRVLHLFPNLSDNFSNHQKQRDLQTALFLFRRSNLPHKSYLGRYRMPEEGALFFLSPLGRGRPLILVTYYFVNPP